MWIESLTLETNELTSMLAFYENVLGFKIISNRVDRFTVACGFSELTFEQSDTPAYYHFAFNIPSRMVMTAANWLEGKGIELLQHEGEKIIQFPSWEAEAMYFHDPAGNIVEFIGRKRISLMPQPTFEAKSIIGISEIGIPTPNLAIIRERLNFEVRVPLFGAGNKQFCALGDDTGLFILIDCNEKRWMPLMEPAIPFPFRASIKQFGRRHKIAWRDDFLVINSPTT